MNPSADSIDLVDVARSLRRGWRSIAAYTVAGLIIAAGVQLFAPKRYQASVTVVVRSAEPLSGLSKLLGAGGGGGMLGADAADALGGGRSQMETELQIFQSEAMARTVIDSLSLQARVKSPRGVAPWRILREVNLPGSFKKKTVTVERQADGRFRVSGAGIDTLVGAAATVSVLGGTISLGDSPLAEFSVQLLDHEDALERFRNHLGVNKAGGEVVRIGFDADDSLTAARVPTMLLAAYQVRRKTTDRGLNQHRAEFLSEQIDSTEIQLSAAERALRRFQEATGVMSAEVAAKVGIERNADLRKELIDVEVESGMVNQLLQQVANGTMDQRNLAAFPSFVRGTSLSELVVQLSSLDADRIRLLERRTERDPEVQAIAKSITAVEAQFIPMAQAYAASLTRRRTDIALHLDSLQRVLGVLPATAESGNRLQGEVYRLGQIYSGLRAELVQAKLAAVGEGGEVRQLDVALAPKKAVFPRPLPTFGAGGLGGLVVGILAALALSTFGRWARDPAEIARTAGVPALRFDRSVPLIVANGSARAILVVPLHGLADTLGVAKQVVETALSRSLTATLLDLGDADGRVSPTANVNGTIVRLATEFDTVVVRLPALTSRETLAALNHERTVVLVVPHGRVAREELVAAMETLRRLEVPCAGIIVSGGRVSPGLTRGANAVVT